MALNLAVRFQAEGDSIAANARVSRREIEQLTGTIDRSGRTARRAAREFDIFGEEIKESGNQANTLKNQFRELTGLIGGLSFAVLLRETVQIGSEFEGLRVSLAAAVGSQQEAAENFAFIEQEADRLGVVLRQVAPEFVKLAAAAEGTALEGGGVQDVFTSFSETARVLNLSNEQLGGTFTALTQILSKGRVQAEELLQIAERIPGTYTTAADAFGVTTEELRNLIETGEIQADDFILRFADQLTERFGDQVPNAIQTTSASLNRLRNAVDAAFLEFAEGGTLDAIGNLAEELTAAAQSDEFVDFLQGASEALSVIISLVDELALLLATQFAVAGVAKATTALSAFILNIRTLPGAASTSAAAVTVLGQAFNRLLGPVGLISTAIFAGVQLWEAYSDAVSSAAEIAEDATESLRSLQAQSDVTLIANVDQNVDDVQRLESELARLEERAVSLQNTIILASQSTREGGGGAFFQTSQLQEVNDQIGVLRTELDRVREATQFANLTAEEYFGTTIAGGINRVQEWAAAQREAAEELAATNRSTEDLIKSLERKLNSLQNNRDALLTEARAAITAGRADASLLQRVNALVVAIDKETAARQASTIAKRAQAEAERELEQAQRLASDVLSEFGTAAQAVNEQVVELQSQIEFLAANSEELAEQGIEASDAIALLEAEIDRLNGTLADTGPDLRFIGEVISDVKTEALDVDTALLRLGLALEEALGSGNEQLVREIEEAMADLVEQTDILAQVLDTVDGSFESLFDVLSAGGGFGDFADVLREDAGALFTFVGDTADFASRVAGALNSSDSDVRNIFNAGREIAQFFPVASAAFDAIAAIDGLVGGKLLGTDYETVANGLRLVADSVGFAGEEFTRQERERSFFRGTASREETTELADQFTRALEEFFEGIRGSVDAASRALSTDIPDFVGGNFEQEFDADGNLVRSISTVLGRTFNEGVEDFQNRVLAENIIATVATTTGDVLVEGVAQGLGNAGLEDVLRGEFGRLFEGADQFFPTETFTQSVNEAQAIAERWRGSADDLLEGAQLLLAAQTAIVQGQALLGENQSLTETVDFVEELARGGEDLGVAFSRLFIQAQTLEDALIAVGSQFDGTREDLVRFVDNLASAFGDAGQLQSALTNIFNTLFDPEEILTNQLLAAQDSAEELLNDIGLTLGDATADQVADLVTQALTGAVPPDVAEDILRAADAFSTVINLEEQLSAARIQATSELAAAIRGLDDEIAEFTLSDFERELQQIQLDATESTNELNALARATGRTGASSQELGRVYQRAALQTEAAIGRIRGAAAALQTQIQDITAELNGDIATTATSSFTSEIDGARQAARDFFAEIQQFLDDLLLSDLTVLTPEQQLAEALRQFEQDLAGAQAGDPEAFQAVTDSAGRLLELNREFFASGQEYRDIFNRVTEDLRGLEGVDVTGTEPLTNGAFADGTASLNAERRQQLEDNRLALVNDLFTIINDFADGLGLTLGEAVEGLGVDFAAAVDLLGIDITRLNGTTVSELAGVAAAVGTSIQEVGDALDVSLGTLLDENSPLVAGFLETLAQVPEEIANPLRAELDDIFGATPEEQVNELQELADLVDGLAPDLRRELAPFFDDLIDPETDPIDIAVNQLDELRGVNENLLDLIGLTATANGIILDTPVFGPEAPDTPDDPVIDLNVPDTEPIGPQPDEIAQAAIEESIRTLQELGPTETELVAQEQREQTIEELSLAVAALTAQVDETRQLQSELRNVGDQIELAVAAASDSQVNATEQSTEAGIALKRRTGNQEDQLQ